MTDALERFWSMQSTGGLLKRGTEYVRADTHEKALAKAYAEGLEDAALHAEPKGRPRLTGGGGYIKAQVSQVSAASHDRAKQIAEAIRALPNKYEVKK